MDGTGGGAALLDVAEVAVQADLQALERRRLRRAGGGGVDEVLRRAAQGGDLEVALGRKVVIKEALGDARRARQRVDRDLIVGALAEKAHAQL